MVGRQIKINNAVSMTPPGPKRPGGNRDSRTNMDMEGSLKCDDRNETVKVVLLRHGETEGNVKGVVQGQWDTPLTAKGLESTLRKAEKIQGLAFDAVFCSDLRRTVETLKRIQEKMPGLPEPIYTKELREIDFGDLTGRPKKELMPTILKHKSAPDLPYPNGESGSGFTARVKSFFAALKDRFPGGGSLRSPITGSWKRRPSSLKARRPTITFKSVPTMCGSYVLPKMDRQQERFSEPTVPAERSGVSGGV
jgi:alpha-ribazole phosphatase